MQWHNQLYQFLLKLQSELLWDQEKISEVLAVKIKDLNPEGLKNIHYHQVEVLCSYLGITIESLIGNTVDFPTIKKNLYSSKIAIPDKYLVHAGSYMSGFRFIYNFMKKKYNQKTADSILRHFQLSKDVIANDSIMVNCLLTNAIFDHLVA